MNRFVSTFTLFASTLSVCAAAQAAPPAAVQQTICRPHFHVDGQVLSAGTAFAIDLPGPASRTLLATAIHLFGPPGGLKEAIPAAELAQRVSGVECNALGSDDVWHAGRALTISGARPMDGSYLKDAAAFVLDKAGKTPTAHLKLAAIPPKPGDTVWLLAQAVEGAPPTQLLHRAVVRHAGDDGLQYEFDNAALAMRATSGAPALNDDGDVVGIHLGGGKKDGKLLGIADSLTSLRSLLGSAR